MSSYPVHMSFGIPRVVRRGVLVGATLALASIAQVAGAGTPRHTTPAANPLAYVSATPSVVPRALAAALWEMAVHKNVPSYSRQTHLACSACHYQFPALTPFGRLFKLNGYTLSGLPGITAQADSASPTTLDLAPFPPAAAMVVASFTQTRDQVPGTANGSAAFPQEMSLFLAGKITPRMGAFTQFTYAGADGSFGIDNVDIRFANHSVAAGSDLLYGVTLHNNPTVQDVWNTIPAWSAPFMSSESVPGQIAGTVIDGGLAQQVLGLGAYGLWNGTVYGELTAYRSAPQGAASPLDSTAANAATRTMPYWRLALQHQFNSTYVMVGGYGLAAALRPAGITGPTDNFTDVALDAQVEKTLEGAGTLVFRSTYIHERQQLHASYDAAMAEAVPSHLATFRANASWYPSTTYGLTGGYFSTAGQADTLRYAPGPVSGSATGLPDTRGIFAELAVNPWQNTRIGAQYTMYSRFNGASSSYDGAGRSASGNNTLYLFTWIAF